MKKHNRHPETEAVRGGTDLHTKTGPVTTPIYQTASFEVADNDLESTAKLFADLPKKASAIVGVGGGKALDVAKYVGFLSRLPFAIRGSASFPKTRRLLPRDNGSLRDSRVSSSRAVAMSNRTSRESGECTKRSAPTSNCGSMLIRVTLSSKRCTSLGRPNPRA